MNILLDFIPFQSATGIGGAQSFTKAVCDEVCLRRSAQDKLFATYNSTLPHGRQYNYEEYAHQNDIQLLDISHTPIRVHINTFHIDVFFIAIAQFYARYSLDNIQCKVVMGIHDIWDVESDDNKVELTIHDRFVENNLIWLKRIADTVLGRYNRRQHRIYQHLMPLYTADNTIAYTVSNYTRNALKYYFPELSKKKIHVFYSSARQVTQSPEIESKELIRLINSGKKYLFMVAANRRQKNAKTLKKVYLRLLNDFPDLHLLTLKYGHTVHPNHIDIDFLSDSDMQHAYSNALVLVFGSFFEGFGYPPVEAMRYGTPTAASNVTSIPEILGDAAIYFSPFYPADMYKAIRQILDDPKCIESQIRKRYVEVTNRQKDDLNRLTSEIFRIP